MSTRNDVGDIERGGAVPLALERTKERALKYMPEGDFAKGGRRKLCRKKKDCPCPRRRPLLSESSTQKVKVTGASK